MASIKLLSDEISVRLKLLNRNPHGEWQVLNKKLCKDFVFEGFQSAMVFMSKCTIAVDKMSHHPEWCNVYNIVSVQLTTHEAGGITCLDFELAALMEEVALNV